MHVLHPSFVGGLDTFKFLDWQMGNCLPFLNKQTFMRDDSNHQKVVQSIKIPKH